MNRIQSLTFEITDKINAMMHLEELVEDVLEFELLESKRGLRLSNVNIEEIRRFAEEAVLRGKTHSLNYYFSGETKVFRTDERLAHHIIDRSKHSDKTIDHWMQVNK